MCIEDFFSFRCELGKGELASTGIALVLGACCKDPLYLILVKEGL